MSDAADYCWFEIRPRTYYDEPEYCSNFAEDGSEFCVYHMEDQ